MKIWLAYKLVAGTIWGVSWAVRRWRLRKAQSWPLTHGVVELTRMVSQEKSEKVMQVTYSYCVNGEFYAGWHRVAYKADLAGFSRGERVLVHYKPANPSISSLNLDDVHSRKQVAAA
jgi:hypothetical protein